jgi:hypothetical protein
VSRPIKSGYSARMKASKLFFRDVTGAADGAVDMAASISRVAAGRNCQVCAPGTVARRADNMK